MFLKKVIPFVLFFFTINISGFCKISLPDILCDSMVLQRNAPVPIWGKSAAGKKITVQFNKQTHSSTADQNGNWKIVLDPMLANATPTDLMISGDGSLTLKNILVGEVWLCSGQSNMQWEVQQSDGGEEAIANADFKNIRLFNVSRDVGFKKKEGKLAIWKTANPQSVKRFSGVGYFYALELYQELGVPIGMINSSYGGTQAEAWTPREYLNASPDLKPCVDRENIWAAERDSIQIVFDRQMAGWKKRAEAAKFAKLRTPGKPRVPAALRPQRIAGSIFYNMVEPLIPFRIKGVLWYQGESNGERAEQYELLLSTMIRSWREKWGQGDFPFGIVQLPNFRDYANTPTDQAWAHLRDRQRKVAMTTPNTGLIVTIDLGEAHDIHPANKLDVGKRLFLWAMADVYGKNVKKTGPLYSKVKFKKGKATIYFDEVGTGLKTQDGSWVGDFAIAGPDKKWHWAKAKIKGKNKVVVWNDKIKNPVAVRYAFNRNPNKANLTNDSGLPASPFRTDDWAGPTAGKR